MNAKLCGSNARAILKRPDSPTQAFCVTDSNVRAERWEPRANAGRSQSPETARQEGFDRGRRSPRRAPPGQLQGSDASSRRGLPRFFDPERWVTPGNHWNQRWVTPANHWNRQTRGRTAGWSRCAKRLMDGWWAGRKRDPIPGALGCSWRTSLADLDELSHLPLNRRSAFKRLHEAFCVVVVQLIEFAHRWRHFGEGG